MVIHRAPFVLVIQLKRFTYANMNAKVNKAVRFTADLSIPCDEQSANNNNNNDKKSNNADRSKAAVKYQLYAVIVHQGSSTHSGHYYAYVKVWMDLSCDAVLLEAPPDAPYLLILLPCIPSF